MEDIVTWLAPAATTLAALMTASNLGPRITGYGFAVFTIGSIAWLALGLITGQPNLVWQNAILTFLNLFGIWSWLFRQARIEDGGNAAQERSLDMPGEPLFPASALSGAKLLTSSGEPYGNSVDAMVGCRSGRLAYVVIGSGGVAGVGETFRRVDWSALHYADDGLRARLSRGELDRLQQVEKDEWPGK